MLILQRGFPSHLQIKRTLFPVRQATASTTFTSCWRRHRRRHRRHQRERLTCELNVQQGGHVFLLQYSTLR